MIVKYVESVTGTEVFISEVILDKIQMHVTSHYPKEFGGILSGIQRGNSYFILDIVIPKKFKNSHAEFVRHPEGINEYLKRVFEVTDGFIEYLGEWHSHPDGSSAYSEHDKTTMLEISDDRSVKLNTPLLLIIALKVRSIDRALYLCKDKTLLKMQVSETI